MNKMTKKEFDERYWRYYTILEKRFLNSTEYVELHKDNYKTFSNMYAFLIQTIGAELDVIFKLICGIALTDYANMNAYANYFLKNSNCDEFVRHIDVKKQEIIVEGYEINFIPFKEWDLSKPSESLPWWKAFTNLKHNRFENLHEANQENTLNILGALYFIEVLYLNKISGNEDDFNTVDVASDLFKLKGFNNPMKEFDFIEIKK